MPGRMFMLGFIILDQVVWQLCEVYNSWYKLATVGQLCLTDLARGSCVTQIDTNKTFEDDTAHQALFQFQAHACIDVAFVGGRHQLLLLLMVALSRLPEASPMQPVQQQTLRHMNRGNISLWLYLRFSMLKLASLQDLWPSAVLVNC